MVIREKIDEIESLNKENINEIINITLASAQIEKITIKENFGDWDSRSNINLFIYGQIGSTKSTLLKQIAKQTKSRNPYTDMTYPALIGSVDKMTRQLIVGACWNCRNKLMLLDEFNFSKKNKDDLRALLQLIEGGEYSKKLASFSSPIEEKDKDLFYNFKDGDFDIKTRFSLIIATMKYPYTSQNQEVQALVSRSITIPFYPDRKILKEIAHGKPLFKFKDLAPKEKNIIISKANYNKILDYVDGKSKSDNFLRIIGDCVRVFAVVGKHRFDLYDLIIKLGSKKFQSKQPKK